MQIFRDLLIGELKLYLLLVTPVALYLIYNARARGQSRASGTNTSTDARKRVCVLCNEVRGTSRSKILPVSQLLVDILGAWSYVKLLTKKVTVCKLI